MPASPVPPPPSDDPDPSPCPAQSPPASGAASPAKSPDPLAALDAETVNQLIRAFLSARRGRVLTRAERAQYEALRARWVEAVRERFGKAA
ncbi:hypothetical protein ACFP1Z_24805 [Streptomyces gamaensis]|uniref:Uncharacterized protein n=1 Tax=Streptomyces gamaensis TaxID=1763542 RepID=A0ABW0Z638_9ACTN